MKVKMLILILLGCFSGCDDYRRANEPTPEITVNSKSLTLFVGETHQLTASPAGNVFAWSSDDPEVAAVTPDGLVTAAGEGSTTIAVRSGEAIFRVSVVTYVRIPLNSFTLGVSWLNMFSNRKQTVEIVMDPLNANDVPVAAWTSDNPAVALVNADGQITSTGLGETTVRCRMGGTEKAVTVTVSKTMPFKGPHILSSTPLTLYFRDFDLGGEGLAFHDTSTEAQSTNYRSNNGDNESNTVMIQANNTWQNIGGTAVGEWLLYTVEVAEAGDYQLIVNQSSNAAGQRFHIELDAAQVFSTISTVSTGGWHNYDRPEANVDAAVLTLTEGIHKLKFVIESAGINLLYMRFEKQ
jgi:hypothetical protein